MNNTSSKERGAVALITAMIVSILLMITTAGMVSLTVKSLRQSTDGAQSTKAYYAAEGGLEEALLKIRKGDDANSCTGAADPANTNVDGAITCTTVTPNANQLTGPIGANQTVQLDFSAVENLDRIKVEWSQGGNLAAVPNYVSQGFRGQFGTLGSGLKWSSQAPAVIELGFVEYPDASSFMVKEVGFYESILAPKSSNNYGMQSQPFINYSFSDAANSRSSNKAYISECVTANNYQCSMLVGGLKANKKYVLRLKTRYNATNYRITALRSDDTVINIPGAMYTIDVTARAGDVFRRVQTSFPIGSTPPAAKNGLDYVLYSDTDICKSFQVKDAGAVEQEPGILSCLPN